MAHAHKSVAVTAVDAQSVVNKTVYLGNVQCIPVDFTVPSATVVQNATIQFSKTLPPNTKIIAMSVRSGTIGNNITIGITGSAAALSAAAGNDTTNVYLGAPLDAGGKEIFATAADTLTAAGTLKGYILIMTEQ